MQTRELQQKAVPPWGLNPQPLPWLMPCSTHGDVQNPYAGQAWLQLCLFYANGWVCVCGSAAAEPHGTDHWTSYCPSTVNNVSESASCYFQTNDAIVPSPLALCRSLEHYSSLKFGTIHFVYAFAQSNFGNVKKSFVCRTSHICAVSVAWAVLLYILCRTEFPCESAINVFMLVS